MRSFHIICGHRFHRLVSQKTQAANRVSVGHSLFCALEDRLAGAYALAQLLEQALEETVIFIGHETD